MAEKEFGFKMKEAIHGVADTVKTSVKEVKLPQIKKSSKTAEEDAVKAEKTKEREKKKEASDKKEQVASATTKKCISALNALKVFYYMMVADGNIIQGEEERFAEIGADFDPNFSEDKDRIISECRKQMDKAIDPEDYLDVLQDGIEDVLNAPFEKSDVFISWQLLLWDLLTIAYSDNSYGKEERKILKYIVRKMDIDKDVFLELECMFLTSVDLENELAWIKTTDRPYLKIESMVNELEDRKNVILENVMYLVSL